MDFDSARDDLLVAGVAAACALALTFGVDVLAGVTVPTLFRAAPLGVYFLYLFSRKGGPYGPLDTTRNWVVLTVAVTVAAAAYVVAF
ncbi:hypothetical protein [Halobaculum sp. D14]|uniref:hypothetical protein n=1 Tax=unclassified Halobaculum TaxID=2640896 RepID=UPI003EB8733A